MSRKFMPKEDRLIVEFFEVAGAANIADDLGRTEASVKARAALLKKSGAWGAIQDAALNQLYAEILVGRIKPDSTAALLNEPQIEEIAKRGWEFPAEWCEETAQ